MRITNQTADPVEYEQNGAPPPPNEEAARDQKGTLKAGASADFPAVGLPPYTVKFKAPPEVPNPDKLAEVGGIMLDRTTVVLTSFPVVVAS